VNNLDEIAMAILSRTHKHKPNLIHILKSDSLDINDKIYLH